MSGRYGRIRAFPADAVPHHDAVAQQVGAGHEEPFAVLPGTGSFTRFSGHCSSAPSPSGTGGSGDQVLGMTGFAAHP